MFWKYLYGTHLAHVSLIAKVTGVRKRIPYLLKIIFSINDEMTISPHRRTKVTSFIQIPTRASKLFIRCIGAIFSDMLLITNLLVEKRKRSCQVGGCATVLYICGEGANFEYDLVI